MRQCLECAWYELDTIGDYEPDPEADTADLIPHCTLKAKVGEQKRPCHEVNENEDCQLIEHARP